MTEPIAGRPQPAADEALLEQLTAALYPRPLTPSPESVAALRRAVGQKWRPSGGPGVIGQLASWARRLQRTGAVVAALAGVAVGGTGVALAAKGSIPRPVQYTLHGLQYTLRDLGFAVPSSAAHYNVGHPPVEVGPEAAPQPAPTTPPRGSTEPVATAATSQTVSAPGRPSGRRLSGRSVTKVQLVSTPAVSYPDNPLAAGRPSPPATSKAPAHGIGRANGCSTPASLRGPLAVPCAHKGSPRAGPDR